MFDKKDHELEAVKKIISEWYKAATEMNLSSGMTLLGDDFVALNPGQPVIRGKDSFRDFMIEYWKQPRGPVTLGESWVDLSDSGDFAYEYGAHNHVVLDGGGRSHVSVWKQLMVLKKVSGVWKVVAVSETNLV